MAWIEAQPDMRYVLGLARNNRLEGMLAPFFRETAAQLEGSARAFAYLLVRHLRAGALAGTSLARATAGTIRLRLLKVAAQVTVGVRRIHVRLCGACPMAGVFARAHAALTATGWGACPAGMRKQSGDPAGGRGLHVKGVKRGAAGQQRRAKRRIARKRAQNHLADQCPGENHLPDVSNPFGVWEMRASDRWPANGLERQSHATQAEQPAIPSIPIQPCPCLPEGLDAGGRQRAFLVDFEGSSRLRVGLLAGFAGHGTVGG